MTTAKMDTIITFHGGNADGLEAKYSKPLPPELKFKGHYYRLKADTRQYHWDGEE
jgi:hypothetical protein